MALRGPFMLSAPADLAGTATTRKSSGIYVRGEYAILFVTTAKALGGAVPTITIDGANIDDDAQYGSAGGGGGLLTPLPALSAVGMTTFGQLHIAYISGTSNVYPIPFTLPWSRLRVISAGTSADTITALGIRAYLGVGPDAGPRMPRLGLVSIPHCSVAADGTITATKLDSLTGIPAGAIVTGSGSLDGGAKAGHNMVTKVNYSTAPSASTSPAPGRQSLSMLPAPAAPIVDATLTFTW